MTFIRARWLLGLRTTLLAPSPTNHFKNFSKVIGSTKVRCLSSAQISFYDTIDKELEAIRNAGTWKSERIITTQQSSTIGVINRKEKVLNFCANNYLGLSNHPKVIEAAKLSLDNRGNGLSSVRFICGTQDIHKELEKKIAKFHNRDDAILFSSCFDANAAIFEAILNSEDAVISDELNHASIIDGIRLCKAQKFRYQHRNMIDLEEKLKSAQTNRLRLIVTDGVFSMDGNVAPLKEISALADKYDALLFIDESHSTGFFGKTGRGTEEYHGLNGRADIINSTLGKALGGAAGGYTTGNQKLIDLLRNKARPYLFSNSLPPAVVAAASMSFDLIMASSDLIKKLSANTYLFRTRMLKAGFNVLGDKDHPICPVMLGDAKLAALFAEKMLDKNIFVIGFSFPVVPKGKARIRVQLSSSHSLDDVNKAVDAFVDIGRDLKLIN
ncbi:hypothetical protein HELRODRAFT_185935 [Helobdella robusta]|uniref:Aminotransferase class I/classII large domain-containing protein n=1 Tax=Helobdella robusta TaxID=6412 RepID=T1FNG5_HELRO|nr:hypothetical protein HELRODRAFT_185935 [Helobdella robusta]ESN97279.1 hypothetical protein HELRODRAFT_185935 [Helobdella robusta]